MQLHYSIQGQGEPLVILHGLFGTLENWGAQIKTLAEQFTVIAVDMRNHGRSPHDSEMTYPLMADDVIELLDHLGLDMVNLMGHSMGGKAAMQLVLNYPERVKRLIVVDIAPVEYEHHHVDVFKGLRAVDTEQLTSRGSADQQLQAYVSELSVRAFLLKNLYRNAEKRFAWRMNLDALEHQYQHISQAPTGTPFDQPTLFIKGANSNYLLPEHRDTILSLFPQATYKLIQGAGHWPHAEKPALFSKIVQTFLSA